MKRPIIRIVDLFWNFRSEVRALDKSDKKIIFENLTEKLRFVNRNYLGFNYRLTIRDPANYLSPSTLDQITGIPLNLKVHWVESRLDSLPIPRYQRSNINDFVLGVAANYIGKAINKRKESVIFELNSGSEIQLPQIPRIEKKQTRYIALYQLPLISEENQDSAEEITRKFIEFHGRNEFVIERFLEHVFKEYPYKSEELKYLEEEYSKEISSLR